MTCLVGEVFGINHPRDFWNFWNCPLFTLAISKFSKMHLGNLSQTALPNMRLLVPTDLVKKLFENSWFPFMPFVIKNCLVLLRNFVNKPVE